MRAALARSLLALALLLVLALPSACGRYGPPVRSRPAPEPAPPAAEPAEEEQPEPDAEEKKP